MRLAGMVGAKRGRKKKAVGLRKLAEPEAAPVFPVSSPRAHSLALDAANSAVGISANHQMRPRVRVPGNLRTNVVPKGLHLSKRRVAARGVKGHHKQPKQRVPDSDNDAPGVRVRDGDVLLLDRYGSASTRRNGLRDPDLAPITPVLVATPQSAPKVQGLAEGGPLDLDSCMPMTLTLASAICLSM